MKQRAKRLLSMVLIAAIVLSLLPATLTTTANATDAGAFGISTSSEMTEEEQAAAANNPFGATGENVAFPLLVKSELYITYGWDGDNTSKGVNYVKSYDTTDNSGLPNINVNTGATVGNSSNVGENGNAYMAAAVDGFNPGSGKDEYVVMLGLNARNKRLELSITDKSGKPVSVTTSSSNYIAGVRSGDNLNWLVNLKLQRLNGFLSVASGDFDGDGMDSIIMYEVGAGNTQTPYLQEFNVTKNGNYLVLSRGNKVMADIYSALGGDVSSLTDKDAKNAPKVQMEAADTDKDGYDELVVTVSMNDTPDGKNSMKHLGTQVFIYDKLSSGWTQTARFSMKNDGVSDNNSYADDRYRMVWGTSTVGNVIASDDSGVITDFPEIVTVGMQDNESSAMHNINVDGDDKLVYSVIHCTGMTEKEAGSKNYQGTYTAVGYGTLEANKFTKAGFYEDEDVSPLLQTKCFSYKGAAEAEAVFISGSVYTWKDNAGNGELESLYTAPFYNSSSKKADSHNLTNMQVESVAAGNFDGNEDGREQIVSAYLLKRDDDNNNGFSGLVTIGYYGDSEGEWQASTAPGGNFISRIGKAYVALTDFDCDADSVIVKYDGVEKQWSDPNVMAILVASPYFHDIGLDNNSTTDYGIDRSSSVTEGESHTLTTNIVAGFEYTSIFETGGGFEATIENNFTWSTNNTRSITYTTNYSNTTEDNQVVVYRSPMLVFKYTDVNTGEKLYLAKTLSPATNMISVEEYNAQAESYGLETIDESKMGVPGLPDTYPSTKKQIKTAFGLANENDVLLADTTWANYSSNGLITKGITTEEMKDKSFNYEFDFSFTAYGIIFGAKVGGGAGYGYETTSTVSDGTAIVRSGAVDGGGSGDYDFQWNFATWSALLNGLSIPVCGYLVQNVTAPPSPAENLSITDITDSSLTLQWEAGTRPAEKYNIYRVLEESTDPYLYIGSVSGNDEEFSYQLNGLDSGTTYTFVVRGASGGKESVDSESATACTALPGGNSITINPLQSTYSVAPGDSVTLQTAVAPSRSIASLTMVWQTRASTGNWRDIDGATSNSLTLSNVTQDMDGNQYRLRVKAVTTSASVGYFYSNTATLSVSTTDTAATLSIAGADGGKGTLSPYDPYTGNATTVIRTPITETETREVPATFQLNSTEGQVYQVVTRTEDSDSGLVSTPLDPPVYIGRISQAGNDGESTIQYYLLTNNNNTYSAQGDALTVSEDSDAQYITVGEGENAKHYAISDLDPVTVTQEVEVITGYDSETKNGTALTLSATLKKANSSQVLSGIGADFVITNQNTGTSEIIHKTSGSNGTISTSWTASSEGLYVIQVSIPGTTTLSSSLTAPQYYYASSQSDETQYRLRLQVSGSDVAGSVSYGDTVSLVPESKTGAGNWEKLEIEAGSGLSLTAALQGDTVSTLTGTSYAPSQAGKYTFSLVKTEGTTTTSLATATLSVNSFKLTVTPVWEGTIPSSLDAVTLKFTDASGHALTDLPGNDKAKLEGALVKTSTYFDSANPEPGVYYVNLSWSEDSNKQSDITALNSAYSITLSNASFYKIADAAPVRYEVVGGNGSIDATGEQYIHFASGEQQSQGTPLRFQATPASGYLVKSWKVNGNVVSADSTDYVITPISGGNSQMLTISSFDTARDVSNGELLVQVEFTNQFSTVNYSAVGQGSLTATTSQGTAVQSGASLVYGASVVFTATPGEGQMVKEWKVTVNNGTPETYTWPESGETYRENTLTLSNLNQTSYTVSVEFMQKQTFKVAAPVFVDGSGNSVNVGTITMTDANGETVSAGDELEQGKAITYTVVFTDSNYNTVNTWVYSTDGDNWTCDSDGGQLTYTCCKGSTGTLYVRAVVSVAQSYTLNWKVVKDNEEITDANIASLTAKSGNTTLTSGGSYPVNTPVDFTLALDDSYYVVGWSKGTPTEDGKSATMTLTDDTDVIVTVAQNPTITFNTDGGTEITSITQAPGTDVTAPADPTKTGYTFAGWDQEIPKTMPAEDMTINAQWTINRYTITFDTNGGTTIDPITQDYGTAVTAPENPTKTGYTFAGWDKEIPDTMPAEDMTIKAQWTINRYTITFDTNGGTTIDPITQDYGTAVTAPADPTKTGYTFAGWDQKIPETMPAENVTITAKWTINQYTITFDTNGGTTIAPITQDYGTAVTAPENPTRAGYGFGGWYTDSALTISYVFSTMPSENITLYAKWNPMDGIKYTVIHKYENLDGSTYTTETEEMSGQTDTDTAAQAKNVTGFTAGAVTQQKIKGDGSTVIEIVYTRNTYTLTFKPENGGADIVTTVKYGAPVTAPADLTKTGYTFVGWDKEIPATMPAEDVTITAQWTINQYTITFNTNGGTAIAPITQDYGTAVTAPEDPTKTGYTFAGWDKEIPETMPANNMTITAKWTKNSSGDEPSAPSDSITVPKTEHGSVTVSPGSAAGDTVTITPTPDEGYEVDNVTVTDENGKPVEVIDNGDGTFSFQQPSGKVTITVTFKEAEVEPETDPVKDCIKDGTCPASKFTDVKMDWTHDGIHFCVESGLMNGTGNNTFEPNSSTARAMLVTVLYRLEGEPKVGKCPFSDVPANQWYTDAITWAAENGIVDGIGNNQYAPNAFITREQFATILYRYAVYKGYDVSVGEDTNILSFVDAKEISSWAKDAMQWAVGAGLINGKGENNLDPTGKATRAEMAAILYRFCENVVE